MPSLLVVEVIVGRGSVSHSPSLCPFNKPAKGSHLAGERSVGPTTCVPVPPAFELGWVVGRWARLAFRGPEVIGFEVLSCAQILEPLCLATGGRTYLDSGCGPAS